MSNIVTIVTATYNRSTCLKRLFISLFNQTNYQFKWLLIDDGSTDDTEYIAKKFKNDFFEFEYIKKENSGKHKSINYGMKYIDTPLTFIVDSDDWLDVNAVEIICKYYEKYKENKKICGFSFLRKFPNGNINGKKFIQNDFIDSFYKVRICGNDINSDKAEVFFTEILKKYPFPEYENEKFIGEDIVWMKLSLKYSMVHINEAIYIGEYQNDGLTINRRKNNMKNPKGCYCRACIFLHFKLPIKLLIKNILQLNIYGAIAKVKLKDRFNGSNHKFLFILTFVPAKVIEMKWRKKYAE